LFWINKQHLSGTAGYENYTLSTTATAEQDIQLLLLLLGQAPFIARAMQFGLITIKTVSLRMPEKVWSKAASTINPVSGSLRFPPQQL
jgi:hypothetical protein